jgi:hypothetical protein
MADRDATLHPKRCRTLANLLDGEDPKCSGIMEVNIDIDTALFGNAEDHVEMALDIPVETGRIEPADQIGTKADCLIHQV